MRTLDHADSIMEEHPDSALYILQQIDTASLNVKDELPKYALLKVMATDKNYIDISHDSLISIASAYYNGGSDGRCRFLSNYYSAKAYYNDGEYERAFFDALKAEEDSDMVAPLWKARVYELMGDVCHESYLYDREVGFRQKAVGIYTEAGKNIHRIYAKCDLATALNSNGDTKESACIIREAETNAAAENDSLALTLIKSASLPILTGLGYPRQVIDVYSDLTALSDIRPLTAQDHYYAGVAFFDVGRYDDAASCLTLADECASGAIDINRNRTLQMALDRVVHGNHGIAMEISDSLMKFQNASIRSLMSRVVLRSESAYFNFRKDFAVREAERKNSIWRFSVVIGALIAVIFILVLVLRNIWLKYDLNVKIENVRYMSGELDRMAMVADEDRSEIRRLKSVDSQLKTTRADNEKQRSEILRLHKLVDAHISKRFEIINTLCNAFSDDDSEVSRKILYKEVQREIMSLAEEHTISDLIAVVDACYDGILSKVGAAMPKLKHEDMALLALIYCDFSIHSISIILGKSVKSIYSRKSRLFGKIKENTGIDMPAKYKNTDK